MTASASVVISVQNVHGDPPSYRYGGVGRLVRAIGLVVGLAIGFAAAVANRVASFCVWFVMCFKM